MSRLLDTKQRGERAYACSACGRTYPATALVWRCACGGVLELPLSGGLAWDDIERDEPSLWRYRAVLPLDDGNPAAYFGEGMTPLIERSFAGRAVGFKLDYLFPSGSFKDRGSAVMINRLHQLGVRAVHEDSSGNGGASVAAYAAAAGMACTIYVPATTSAGKLVQIATQGAQVVKVAGARQAVADAAMQRSDGSFYASHNWLPLFIEGVKTLAYEIWEQRGGSLPDAIVAPIGYGSTVLGLYRGFLELKRAGMITTLPRLYPAQAANCAAFDRAFRSGRAEDGIVPDDEVKPTLAEGVASQRPLRVQAVLDALADAGGRTAAVGEDEIMTALRELAEQGLYVEPTSAVAPAALKALVASGDIRPHDDVLVILTGSGLKATDKIASIGTS